MTHCPVPELPDPLRPLVELALDVRWTWSHWSDALWRRIDPVAWEATQNPWVILQSVSPRRLQRLAADPSFVAELERLVEERRAHYRHPHWFHRAGLEGRLSRVAYFSMEFGLGESLPLYAGGLGILAGDTLKTACDLGLPMVGVGLLYQQGYFRQVLDPQRRQLAFYPFNEPASMPVQPARSPEGEWLRVGVDLPGRRLSLRVWRVQVGSVELYLLDSNDPINSPVDRGITAELYGGGSEQRLLQEMVLGIGGWRTLEALGLDVEVCHLNEGHAALAACERLRSHARRHGVDFDTALWATRAGNLFTSHTPVPAGFDRFAPALVARYLRGYVAELGIDMARFLELGRDGDGLFNMAWLAMSLSGAVNGVSRLHGVVSRALFQGRFPRWPRVEVPVSHVTNGVHVPSWDSPEADELWTEACGKSRWMGDLERMEQDIQRLSDEALWNLRTASRARLVEYVRQRLRRQLAIEGEDPQRIEALAEVLDPNVLTLGFARRFAEYKRPNLLLSDPERLIRLLTNPHWPVQLVIAGKAHPQDETGKALVQAIAAFARRPEVRRRMVFLSDYDMILAEHLVQGVDLWINTPRRPWEACGTSGMKLLVNGGLNCSVRDGWWAEAYDPEVGWAVGVERELPPEQADPLDARSLFEVLEGQVVPAFYSRDERGIPPAWVAKMRASMARLAPRFSTNRMLRDYVERHYLPLAASVRARNARGGEVAGELRHWADTLRRKWSQIHFLNLSVESREGAHRFQVQLYLDDIPADWVRLELYAEPLAGGEPERRPMERIQPLTGARGGFLYQGRVESERPASHYTPRLIPHHPRAHLPLELPLILWLK